MTAHKHLYGYIHFTVEQYLNGGAGPGVSNKGVSKLPTSAVRDAFIVNFADKVKWGDVTEIKFYDSVRELGNGEGAFKENLIPPVPDYLKPIVEHKPEEVVDDDDDDE
jgi:hypothetical protein